jgi:hypothetical protein
MYSLYWRSIYFQYYVNFGNVYILVEFCYMCLLVCISGLTWPAWFPQELYITNATQSAHC